MLVPRSHFTTPPWILLAGLLLAPVVHADTAEDTAQLLFDEAQQLMEQGKAAEACPKLDKSLELDAAIGTRFSLAECHEKTGRIASAWRGYTAVADEARKLGQEEREVYARGRADAVRSKLPTVTVVLGSELAKLGNVEVTQDGEALDRALWGTPVPLDPGARRIRVTATGHEPFEREISLEPNGADTRVVVDSLTATAALAPDDGLAPDETEDAGGGSTALLATGIAVGTAGLIVTGIGVGMAMSAKGSYDDAVAEHCVPAGCRPEGVTATEDARSQADVGSILFGVGIGAAAVGGTLAIIALVSGDDDGAEEMGLRVVPTHGGVILSWGGAL